MVIRAESAYLNWTACKWLRSWPAILAAC